VFAQSTGGGAGSLFFLLVAIPVVFGFFGSRMAWKRCRSPGQGLALGFLLGPIGLMIIALMGAKKGPPCVACGTPVNLMWTKGFLTAKRPVPAKVCLACGTQQQPTPPSPVPMA